MRIFDKSLDRFYYDVEEKIVDFCRIYFVFEVNRQERYGKGWQLFIRTPILAISLCNNYYLPGKFTLGEYISFHAVPSFPITEGGKLYKYSGLITLGERRPK